MDEYRAAGVLEHLGDHGALGRGRDVDRSGGCGERQRHTTHRIFDQLRDQNGFTGGYTIVKDYVRAPRL